MKAGAAGPPLWARRLGYGGLIPFVSLAAALWVALPGDWPLARMALLGYGATISSFLGGIHWGLVMREGLVQPMPSLLWGVVPSLLGWVALLLGHAPGLLLVAALLWLCFAVDRVLYSRYRLQAWLPMRMWLTLVASLSCLAGAAALLQ
ncbi:MAG: DUF3429 domain-containing protein [Rubrivivax sp.]|nr:DUF3429 domain-containing protein [Rubrivivax sp.]